MSIEQNTVAPPGTVSLSTTLDPNTVNLESGGGAPSLVETDIKGNEDSIESMLDAELKSLREADAKAEKDAKPDEGEKKPAKDAKPEVAEKDKNSKAEDKKDDKPTRERAQDGKFAKTEKADAAVEGKEGAPDEAAAAGQEASERSRPSEGRQHVEPPARFLPKEREAWANVPNVVKSAIARIASEHDTEVTQYKESHENWQKLSKFDEMAKQHKTTVSDALERYTALDGLLSSNPIEGIRQILATRNITPEQYAQHVLNNPDVHRAPAPQPAPDPAVRTELESVKAQLEEMRSAQAAATIIEPFRAANPRYDELQNDIAFFLQSGKIPASLTSYEKLEAAYDMAVRINPTSEVEVSQAREAPAAKAASPAKLDAGTKSIRGAPDDGADTEVEEPETDLRGMLRKELRKISA